MTCPKCGEKDYYNGVYGHNCANPFCSYFKGSKEFAKNKRAKRMAESISKALKGVAKTTKKPSARVSSSSSRKDQTICMFCKQIPHAKDCPALVARKLSDNIADKNPWSDKDIDFSGDDKPSHNIDFWVKIKGFKKRENL